MFSKESLDMLSWCLVPYTSKKSRHFLLVGSSILIYLKIIGNFLILKLFIYNAGKKNYLRLLKTNLKTS